jgi:transcriptional regulator of heat shock response
MKAQRDIASFVLRFTQEQWQDAEGEPRVQWRGHIRHVQSDEEVRFTDFAEAVAFIQRSLIQLTLNTLGDNDKMEQEKVLRESFKLWEEFASSYTKMMFDAMDQAMKQSEAFKVHADEAVGQAMKSWQLPVQSDQGKIIEALDSLQKQVQTLSKKVEGLEKTMKASGN